MRFTDNQTTAVLAAIIVISFFVSLFFLSSSALLSGLDAPYYLRGVQSILKTGFLPGSLFDWPPVFFYAAAKFSLLFGTIAGIKIAAALFSALLCLSVFLLAKQLFKNNETALVAALFVVIAPVSMRLLNGFWKTSTALFFLPLFFFFFLRARDSKKNLAFAIAVLVIVFLSHLLAGFLALLVLLAFVVFQLVFERKPTSDTKNALVIFVFSVVLVLLAFLFSGKSFTEFAGLFGLINSTVSSSASASLWQYFSVLIVPAFFGALYCFFGAKREQLFLLAWFVAGLFVAFPLTSGDNYWRFSFLLLLPFSLLAASFFSELKKELGSTNTIVFFAVIVLLLLPQVLVAAQQIVPVFNENDLKEIFAITERVAGKELFARGSLLEQLQLLEANAASTGDIFALRESNPSALLVIDKQRKMLDYSEKELLQIDQGFDLEFETARFLVAKPKTEFVFPGIDSSVPIVKRTSRWDNPVLWLFFPAELFNAVQLPFSSLLRALIGLPLSFALIAFVLQQLNKLQSRKNFRFAAIVFVAFLVFLTALAK